MSKKKISLKEKIRRTKQSEDANGVTYKDGVKFVKVKGSNSYKLVFTEEMDDD